MYVITAKKKETLSFAVRVDGTRGAKGHIVFPKAGRHKDKRALPKVAQRARLRREMERN